MKIKSQKDFWSGIMFVVVGVAFALGATSYSFGSSARPGPGYFPLGLGVLQAVLGAFILFKSLVVETDSGEPIGRWAWKPLLTIALSVAVFAWALPLLGMAIALPLLITISSLAGDEFHWKDVILNCLVLTIGSWAVFILGLKLVIPVWPKFITG